MNAKKRLMAGLAGGIVMWGIAGLWHQLVAATFYAEETQATHGGIGIILMAYGVLGLLMSHLYAWIDPHGKPALEGLKFGAIIGLLWVFPHELAMAGAHGEPLPYVFKNASWHVVEQGLGGVVIGLIRGRGARATVPANTMAEHRPVGPVPRQQVD